MGFEHWEVGFGKNMGWEMGLEPSLQDPLHSATWCWRHKGLEYLYFTTIWPLSRYLHLFLLVLLFVCFFFPEIFNFTLTLTLTFASKTDCSFTQSFLLKRLFIVPFCVLSLNILGSVNCNHSLMCTSWIQHKWPRLHTW